jgi:hypothetical protein
VIVWINGPFGAGKSTLAVELCRRRPDAALFDPELIGIALVPTLGSPTGDFQDLPSWREVVAATLVSLCRHHLGPLVVPMTVVRLDYFKQLLGAVDTPVLHFFLEVSPAELSRRLVPRGDLGDGWASERIDAGVNAPTRDLPGTVLLDAERLGPRELGDAVLARL